MNVRIKRLDEQFNDLPLPKYATEGSAGMDIFAAVTEPVTIEPGNVALIPTSLSIALERGYECQVRSRSGLAIKHGIFALNSPGTVDSDYRGERIAQLVVARYETVNWMEVEELPDTERGNGGFGSTGH